MNTCHTRNMNTSWQIAVRRTMLLPTRTRSILLPILARNACFTKQHHQRVFNMYYDKNNSKNTIIKFILERGIKSSIGTIGKNHICLGLLYRDINYHKWRFLDDDNKVSTEVKSRASVVRELLEAREGRLHIVHMDRDEISAALEFVCIY